jgi:replicative DNA helicase
LPRSASAPGRPTRRHRIGLLIVDYLQLCSGSADRRPVLSDLHESGSIERTPTWCCSCFGKKYYLEGSDRRGSPDHIASMGRTELIIGKQRHSATGVVELRFDGALTRFSNVGSAARKAA